MVGELPEAEPTGWGAALTAQLPPVTVKCASALPGVGLKPEYGWQEVPEAAVAVPPLPVQPAPPKRLTVPEHVPPVGPPQLQPPHARVSVTPA